MMTIDISVAVVVTDVATGWNIWHPGSWCKCREFTEKPISAYITR